MRDPFLHHYTTFTSCVINFSKIIDLSPKVEILYPRCSHDTSEYKHKENSYVIEFLKLVVAHHESVFLCKNISVKTITKGVTLGYSKS